MFQALALSKKFPDTAARSLATKVCFPVDDDGHPIPGVNGCGDLTVDSLMQFILRFRKRESDDPPEPDKNDPMFEVSKCKGKIHNFQLILTS